MPDIIHFDDAIDMCGSDNKGVLLGNGFSIAQSGGQFSYSTLLEKCALAPDSPVRNVFQTLNTCDFEVVVNALEHASQIEEAYHNPDQAKVFHADAVAVREALIHAVHQVHPEGSFDVPEHHREACGAFLDNFNSIFTLNYDLMLYWALLHASQYHSDGFGLGQTVNGFRTFNSGANCSTYYMHGALHLFLDEQQETQKRVVRNGTIIREIASIIRERNRLPLFVAEGTTAQKMAKINSVPYLRHCYERLASMDGSVFIFGHSVSSNDNHIYDAIFRSPVERVFFCVHQPHDDWSFIRERLAPFAERRKTLEIIYVDASTAHVWG
jgi:hypothetical protein